MQHSFSLRRTLTAFAVAAAAIVVPMGPAGIVSAADCYCAGGEYQAVTPVRILDTRPADPADPNRPINDPGGAKPIGAEPTGSTFDIDLFAGGPGADTWLPTGVTQADVLGVAVNVTVVGPSKSGYLKAYPSGTTTSASLINFPANNNVANMAIVRPGANGKLTISLVGTAGGSANVLVDVFGWFSVSSYTAGTPSDPLDERGGRVIPITPGRIYDTRTGSGATGAGQPLGAGTFRTVDIAGVAVPGSVTIPADVTGVLINLTGVRPTGPTFVSVTPEDPSGIPATSNLNLTVGETRAAMVIVPVGADGQIRLYNGNGTNNVIVDVLGYIRKNTDETRAGRVIPLSAPFRALDTRQASFGAVPLGPGQAEDWSFAAFANSVNIGGVAVGNQSALIGNLTNAKLNRQYLTVPVDPGFLTVYPTPAGTSGPPTVSNLNSRESVTGDVRAVPNMALVKYGTDYKVRVFNSRGYAHYILDVSAVVLSD